MSPETMKASAKAFIEEFSSGRHAEAWARTTDTVVWGINQHDLESGKLLRYDRASYQAMVESSAGLFPDGVRLDVTGALADGDRVVLEAAGHGPLADGRVYANHYVFTFRFAGDRIAEVVEYLDTAYAQKLLEFTLTA